MNSYYIIGIALLYLVSLFVVAYIGERSKNSFPKSGLAYALSLMVYCTAWTFYGSVGTASRDGISFLAVYVGPLLTIPFWWVLLRKMVRITHILRISSLADFMASRYGKSRNMGTLVALACLLGVLPYIALQLKAISNSIKILSGDSSLDPSFLIALVLAGFAILFGARNVDANQRKPGLMSAIAFESVVKIIAFLVVGVVVCFFMFDGISDIFAQANAKINVSKLAQFEQEGSYTEWVFISMLSALAFLLLPRQFHIACVEAHHEGNILKAMRIVPIYLLLINFFVIPVALVGLVLLPQDDPDFFMLSIPMQQGNQLIAIMAFIGGFAASTSMILVSTTALSTMLSNYIVVPFFLKTNKEEAQENVNYERRLLLWRRLSKLFIILMAYLFFLIISDRGPLVSIGILSFIGIAQLAPAFFGGMYWKRGNTQAATLSISAGLLIWVVLLILPEILSTLEVNEVGSWDGMSRFSNAVAESMGVSPTVAVTILSLLTNIALYVYFSFTREQTAAEVNQAELFVDIFQYSKTYDSSVAWRGTAYFPDIKSLLNQFIGEKRTTAILDRYARVNNIDWDQTPKVDSRVVSYAERVLTGIIGPASARIMVAKVVEEEEIRIEDVLDILQESKEVLKLNKELVHKSGQLARATAKLTEANQKLQKYNDLKNEFLYTVTHELRTPVTSIMAIAEILEDNPDLKEEQKGEFLSKIIYEAERMTRLISDVLDLEKFESGNQQLTCEAFSISKMLEEETRAMEALVQQKDIQLELSINTTLDLVWADKARVQQVLNNLIGNAIKYCHPDRGRIVITADRILDDIQIALSNNASNLEEIDLDILFDKFYQAKHQTRKKPVGHGLGLAISKNIIEMHNRHINVEVKDGMIRFSFALPIATTSV